MENFSEELLLDETIKKKKYKWGRIIFVLCVMLISVSVVTVSFSANTEKKVTISKVWSSDDRSQVDPTYIFNNDSHKLNEKILFIESALGDSGYVENNFYTFDLENNLVSKKDVDFNDYDVYFRSYGDKIYYATSKWNNVELQSYTYIYELDSEFNVLNVYNDKNSRFYEYFDLDEYDVGIDNMSVSKDGNPLVYAEAYSGFSSVYELDKESKSISYVELTDEEFSEYFPQISMIKGRQEKYNMSNPGDTYYFHSMLELPTENKVYFGERSSGGTYYEIVDKDGNVVKSDKSDTYITYSNPILLDKYIVVNARYDEEKTLGTLKSDLVLIDFDGNIVSTLNTNSYYNNMFLVDDNIVTERVYVEGTCTAEKLLTASGTYSTYNVWNADSCYTHHYYEKYKVVEETATLGESLETITKNPTTSVFPILMFVIISIGCFAVFIYAFKKMNN